MGISIATLIVGIALAVWGGAAAAVTFVRSLDTPEIALPGIVHRQLDSGGYDVAQWTGVRHDSAGFTTSRVESPTLTAAEVSVTAPNGLSVPVESRTSGMTTVTVGSRVYTVVAHFDAPVSGDYTISMQTSGGLPRAVVTRGFGTTLRTSAGWVALLASGAFVAVVGLVMLIAGLVRRQRAGPVQPPPGWYPDPGGTARTRWWNGASWTDHPT